MGLFIDNSIRFIRKNLDHILLLALGLLIFIVIKYQFNQIYIVIKKSNKNKIREKLSSKLCQLRKLKMN